MTPICAHWYKQIFLKDFHPFPFSDFLLKEVFGFSLRLITVLLGKGIAIHMSH